MCIYYSTILYFDDLKNLMREPDEGTIHPPGLSQGEQRNQNLRQYKETSCMFKRSYHLEGSYFKGPDERQGTCTRPICTNKLWQLSIAIKVPSTMISCSTVILLSYLIKITQGFTSHKIPIYIYIIMWDGNLDFGNPKIDIFYLQKAVNFFPKQRLIHQRTWPWQLKIYSVPCVWVIFLIIVNLLLIKRNFV